MEEWRPVPGCDGYETSTLGRIRSLDRVLLMANGGQRKHRGRVLRPGVHSAAHPYPQVNLGKLGGHAVHRLVASAFLGPRPPGHYVCHRDGDPTNCAPSNLYYGTPAQNQADRARHGTATNGERHPQARIARRDAQIIRDLLARGEKQQKIADHFGITQSQVSHISTGKSWADA